jgi:hypothetical protein
VEIEPSVNSITIGPRGSQEGGGTRSRRVGRLSASILNIQESLCQKATVTLKYWAHCNEGNKQLGVPYAVASLVYIWYNFVRDDGNMGCDDGYYGTVR